MNSPHTFLLSDDPLSRDAAIFLAEYAEEDDRVDYKLTMDTKSNKSWLELTKDVSAFANTFGGYLVFGFNDQRKEIQGISRLLADSLKDINNILQKINRNLEPHITGIRSKTYRIEGKTIGLLYVPQSFGRTHVISKDGDFDHLSGKSQTLIRKGTFYVRRSGGNHLGDSRDLDDVIERRIDQFRSALMDKFAKVVYTPATSDVYVLSKDRDDPTGKRFVIEDSPDAIPIKGMSFTVAPEGPEEEIAGWTVLCGGDPSRAPPASLIWKWYADREDIELSKSHKLALLQFSLWNDVPPFFWIIGLKNADIRKALLEAIRKRPLSIPAKQMLVVASFLGKTPFNAALTALGRGASRLAPVMQHYPKSGPAAAFGTIEAQSKQMQRCVRRSFANLTKLRL